MPATVGFFTALVWAPLRFRFAILLQVFRQAGGFRALKTLGLLKRE
jgi:hypothetical protein